MEEEVGWGMRGVEKRIRDELGDDRGRGGEEEGRVGSVRCVGFFF